MAVISYFAKTVYVDNHILGDEYTLEMPYLTVLNPSEKLIFNESVSISGNRQSVVSRLEEYYTLETDHIIEASDEYLSFCEFWKSVNRKEIFKFAEFSNFVDCQLDGDIARSRGEPAAPVWVFKFKIRVINA